MKSRDFKELGFKSFQQYSFPTIINVCVIRGSCPCRCIHCPVGITLPGKRIEKFGQSVMSLALFKEIVREMSEYHHSVLRIHGVGEPILWQELPTALEFAFMKKVRTWLFTCLVTEDKLLLEKLAEYCSIIEISINSIDENDYKSTKGIDSYTQVHENLRYLKTFAESINSPVKILVSRVESEAKQSDTDFIEYWKSNTLADDAFIRSFHNYNSLLRNTFKRELKEIIPCLVHWNRFNIDCDGSVVLCFNELFKGKNPDEKLILGNRNEQTISEIWHCKKINLVRKAQLEKDYSLIKFTDDLPCINCFSCQPLDGKNPTSENQLSGI